MSHRTALYVTYHHLIEIWCKDCGWGKVLGEGIDVADVTDLSDQQR